MTPELPPRLASLHRSLHAQAWLRRFTLMNRVLLAMAFLPTGLVKALGQRFTQLPVDNPVGFFFEAMYRTGPYWNFIGWVQIVAAIALLVPRTSALGAVLFAPIGISVFLITIGVGFGGTVWITGGMLLSVTYLLCWDADRLWSASASLLNSRRQENLPAGMHWIESTGWIVGTLAGIAFFLGTRGLVPTSAMRVLVLTGLAAIALVIVGWIAGGLRARRAPASS